MFASDGILAVSSIFSDKILCENQAKGERIVMAHSSSSSSQWKVESKQEKLDTACYIKPPGRKE